MHRGLVEGGQERGLRWHASVRVLARLAEPDAHRDGVQLGAQLPPQAQQRSPLRHGLLLAARRRLPLHRRLQGQRLRGLAGGCIVTCPHLLPVPGGSQRPLGAHRPRTQSYSKV